MLGCSHVVRTRQVLQQRMYRLCEWIDDVTPRQVEAVESATESRIGRP
jgi:hypothetical protein